MALALNLGLLICPESVFQCLLYAMLDMLYILSLFVGTYFGALSCFSMYLGESWLENIVVNFIFASSSCYVEL